MPKPYPLILWLEHAWSLAQLDKVALNAANEGHTWTPDERATYERCVREFKRGKRNPKK